MRKEKRGQFFIVFAVILGIIILGLATVFNVVIKTGREETMKKKFNTMCENYREEIFRVSQYVINTSNKSGEPGLIKNFTINFLKYAKKNDPDFQLIYVYGNTTYVNILNATRYEITVITVEGYSSWESIDGYAFMEITDSIDSIEILGEKINKTYKLSEDERFWFVALTEKEGEEYVCE